MAQACGHCAIFVCGSREWRETRWRFLLRALQLRRSLVTTRICLHGFSPILRRPEMQVEKYGAGARTFLNWELKKSAYFDWGSASCELFHRPAL